MGVLWQVLYFPFGTKSTKPEIYFLNIDRKTFWCSIYFIFSLSFSFYPTVTQSQCLKQPTNILLATQNTHIKDVQNVRSIRTPHSFSFQCLWCEFSEAICHYGMRSLTEWPSLTFIRSENVWPQFHSLSNWKITFLSSLWYTFIRNEYFLLLVHLIDSNFTHIDTQNAQPNRNQMNNSTYTLTKVNKTKHAFIYWRWFKKRAHKLPV